MREPHPGIGEVEHDPVAHASPPSPALSAERWSRLKERFFAALEMPKTERARLVESFGDLELKSTLEAMLAATGTESDALAAGLDAARRAALQATTDGDEPRALDDAPFVAGRRIGPYELVRLLGEGGMGAVYLAQRSDPEFRQEVAIKLVRNALLSPAALARFKFERRTLAQLAHPNIARLLDGGATEEGLPYLVLEYVEGSPIDRYCDTRALDLDRRLELFLQVASGVEHAHAHLIVHRDLKPGNILVGEDGTPKLLDFGIAKLLDVDSAAEARRTSTHALTPAWASPEQIVGSAITTATDVHALGILLYRLIVGVHPFETENSTPIEIAQAICELEPQRPSLATADAALRRRVAGELDTIVLRALAKEPERRYPSVAAFGEDLRRWREGLPVAAHPDSLGYRARKFAARHRWGLLGAATAAVSLAVAASIALVQAAGARHERDRAKVEADKTARMNAFLRSVLTSPDPVRGAGRELRVADLLAHASTRLAGELRGQPALEADLRATLAQTDHNLGLLEEAEREERRVLELVAPGTVPEAEARAHLAATLNARGRYAEAEREAQRAVTLLRSDAANRMLLATALDELGVALQNQGRGEPAIAAELEAVQLFRVEGAPARGTLATTLNNLGIAFGNSGKFAEAEAAHREAVELARAEWGERHPNVAEAVANLAGVLDIEGKFAEAESMYREALALQEELVGESHFDFLRTLTSYANLLWLMKRPADALAPAERALALATAHGADGTAVAYAENILGGVLLDLGRAREAEGHIRAAFEARKKLFPPGHWLTASAQSNLGAALLAEGRLDEAERELRAAYTVLLADRGPEHEKTKLTASRLAELVEKRGRRAPAAD